MAKLTKENLKIVLLDVKDVRFPTSLGFHGSDAMHTDPNYSCAYVTIRTAQGTEGHGLAFTIGRGTEIVVKAVNSLKHIIIGESAIDIYKDFAQYWRLLTSESQLRWIGPEKGVIHLATAAIVNALWDLWAKILNKPLWRLLVDMEPEQLVSTIDFRYLSDAITKEEAIHMLRQVQETKEERIAELENNGYPAYSTQIGWIGYSHERVVELCEKYVDLGFNAFKIKVGQNLKDDIYRCSTVRNAIGWDKLLMVDANQVWETNEAVNWMKELAQFKIHWIEEPTSPDDIFGHAKIAKELKSLGIGVATGEMCCNRVMFKQFLEAEAMEYCQVDACRVGGVNELLAIYFLAKKFNVKVCPHAGGLGLCEMIQHLQMWDYVSLSATMENRMIEYVDVQHDMFIHPAIVQNARYVLPKAPGYNTQMTVEAIEKYQYPNGSEWKNMFEKGLFHPSSE